MRKSNNYLVQGSILAIASLLTRVIGMLYKIPLTRMIGREGMAYYGAAYEVYSIVLILSSLSIPLALSKLISAKEQQKEYQNTRRIFRISLILASCTGGAASLLIYFGAERFAAMTGYPSAKFALQLLAPTLFVVAIMGVFRGLFQGKRTMVPTALSQIFEQIINAVISILAAWLLMKTQDEAGMKAAFGAGGGTLGTLCGAIAGMLFLLFVFYINRDYFRKKAENDVSGKVDSNRVLFQSVCMTLFPIILSQTVYQISGILDVSLFGKYMESIGVLEADSAILLESYNNKYRQLTNIPVAIATALSAAIVPSLTASYQENNLLEIRKKIGASIKMNMIVAIPATVGMGMLGPQIIQMLYNDTSEISANLLRMGSIAIAFFAYSTMTNGVLQGINRLRTPVIHSAISLAIHIGLLYFMLHYLELGVYSLVIGNVSFAFIICILNWITIKQLVGYRQEIKKTFLLPTLASAVMGVLTYLTYLGSMKLFQNNTICTILSLLVAVAVYFLLFLLLRVADEEELKSYPMGVRIIRLAKKLRLLR